MGSNEEAHIQIQIVKLLQKNKIFFHSCPNELGGSNKIRTMQMKSLGLRAGAADLIVFHPPKTVTYVEVKTQIGKQSKAQLHFEQMCKDHGLKYILVRSVEDVKKAFDID